MIDNRLKSRIISTHDIEANWNKVPTFIPKKGEIIIYDAEITDDGSIIELPEGRTSPYTYARQKIGDGITAISDLPFVGTQEPSIGIIIQRF